MREYLHRKPWKRRDQAIVAERKRQRKLKLIELKGGKCHDCESIVHFSAFQFDHREPSTKLHCIAQMLSGKWDKAVVEAEKCDLVCANCHAVRTYTRCQYSHPRKPSVSHS